ncbi:MAG: lysozyme [Sphingomonadales bacterium]|nr:MAG: lysozyme [Sphingomonadales bacterium]
MARNTKQRRRRSRLYLLATLALALLAGLVWYWWDLQRWVPDETAYPEQGIAVGERQGLVGFETARALGASFAYIEASLGADGKDQRFGRNLEAAKRAGLLVGAEHHFDPCTGADRQSANFVTMVPRDAGLLPPAIALIETADICAERVSDAAVESELLTFINQVELHAGKPVVLKLSAAFEARYGIAMKIERDLWLMRDRFEPDYGQRPWLLWSANGQLASEASDEPVEWVVVQP